LIRRLAVAGALGLTILALAAPVALSAPTADSAGAYQALGRVFPDPLAGCQNIGASPCSPNAQGNIPATQFIGYDEFIRAIGFMNTQPQWQRYMEVWPLDGKLGDGAGNAKAPDVPGNNLEPEFKPDPKNVSAGLPTTSGDRQKHDLIVIRVTDESVPDKDKKRYALSLSIHGIERAGVEGGTRAMEDLVTAYTTGLAAKRVVPKEVDAGAPTFGDVLKHTIIYFTYPNPDGWARGQVTAGNVFFQRYNGNGVDVNRDWPDIGFSFRPYSGLSEPESRALSSFLNQVKTGAGNGQFAAGDDLHGQPEADALSYTLLPHGSHPYDKDIRIRETAKTIHENSEQALKWSPIIQPNDAPQGGGVPCAPDGPTGTACSKIYGQTWGSVYDTINYTTTGALGDYFDSSVGLGADGIDNEMSFSHLDKNITFEPNTEQLHVDGNKALIYAHLDELSHPATGSFDAPGIKGYVPNKRVKGGARDLPAVPPGTHPHADIDVPASSGQPDSGGVVLPIGQIGGAGIYNGGMRVDITATNVQGVGAGVTTLQVQCQHCDTHRSKDAPSDDPDRWITVAEDYNQSPVYLQAGLTAAVNEPDSDKEVNWRAVVSSTGGAPKAHVEFSSGPATTDGATGGDNPPRQRAYDVANTDFFKSLNQHLADPNQDFETVDPAKVIAGKQSLDDLTSLVLADDPLPGFTGTYGGKTLPTGGPTANIAFSGSADVPGAVAGPGVIPGSTFEKEFTIGPNDSNKTATVRVDWADANNDFDLFVDRVESDGSRTEVASSANGGTNFEEAKIDQPAPGKYVIQVLNFASADGAFTGKVTFEPLAKPTVGSDTGSFSIDDKNKWAAALRKFVSDGGNLVLTDGALQILPEITGIDEGAINRQTVYAGQIAFGLSDSQSTVKDRLARNIDQPGARFNSGFRRQMYEPTPLGFAIQDAGGGDQSNAVQWDIDRAAWEKAGGRTAGTSADSGTRDAAAVFTRTALGELPLGKGQIRIAGAMLPQPTEKFDHPFGLEPYATTYTSYIVMRNLLDTTAKGLPGLPGDRDNPAPGDKKGGSATGAGGKNTGRNFVISRRAVKLKGRIVAVRVSCRSIKGCKGKLKLTFRQKTRTKNGRKSKTVTLGTASFSYKARTRNSVVKVKLSKKLARAASVGRRQKVSATASVRFGDGTSGRTTKAFWLYRPSKR
jgi:hypothetical protein